MYDYYVERLNEVRSMSCKPKGISLVKDGYVFNEDKSVKWNREQVTKNNQEYQDEVKRLNQEKMQKREEVYSDFYKSILESLSIATGGKKFSMEQAKIIWKYMEGHLQDTYDIATPLDELIDMIADFVTYKPTKQRK